MSTDKRTFESTDDIDPIVDALLAEFVPENPSDRKTPPDLSGEILRKLAELTSDELASDELASVDSGASVSAGTGSHLASRRTTKNANARRLTTRAVVSLIVGVAACFAGVVWVVGEYGSPAEQPVRVAEESLTSKQGKKKTADATKLPAGTKDSNMLAADNPAPSMSGSKSPKGIRLDQPKVVHSGSDNAISVGAPSESEGSRNRGGALESIASVSERLNKLVVSYWDSLELTPTDEAKPSELATRFGDQLNVPFGIDEVTQVQRIESLLSKRSNSRRLATRWLGSALGKKAAAIGQDANAGLVKELGLAFSPKGSFSTTLVSLVDGSSKNASAFYNLLDDRSKGGGDKVELAHQLASLTMNSDLRCVRCHDSMIGRVGTQEDHWSFVTLLRKSLMRTSDGWKFEQTERDQSAFFELPDGRMQLVEPAVSNALFESAQLATDLSGWAKQLASSPQFAGSVVDSLWMMVHQRRLTPSPIDAFAPPADDSLVKIRDELVQDLLASDFDVSRTLALIVVSPMNRRSVPVPLLPANSLTSSDTDRALAMEKVGAFAAAVDRPRASRRQRLDLAVKRVGGSLKNDSDRALLAQPVIQSFDKARSSSAGTKPAVDFATRLGVEFPGNTAPLPVAWLNSIDDYDQQVRHLAYLAGDHNVPREISEVASKLRSVGSKESALSRLWWIMND